MVNTSAIYEFGPFRVDGSARLVFREGQTVPLPPKVVETLLILVENAGSVVSREVILRRVWPDTFVDENNLAQNISMLRRTLDYGSGPSVETIPKRGYRFVAILNAAEPIPVVSQPPPPPRSRIRTKWALAALLLVFLGAATYYFTRTRDPALRTLAVLPFQSLSGIPNDEYLADGLTELLIDNLAKVGSLRVISRTSSMHFKGSRKKLQEIARELKVDAVMEGSVMRSGDRARVAIKLILGATGELIWSESYDRDAADVASLQLDIVRTIAREAHIKMSPVAQVRLDRRKPLNRASFEEYLRGRHAWNKRAPGDIQRAIAHFQNSIDLDAAYARPTRDWPMPTTSSAHI